jgi:Fe-S-cluster containining protein
MAGYGVHANEAYSDSGCSNVPSYNCAKCPGYCCSYPLIPLTKRDVERLAKHFNLDFEAAKKKFTKADAEAKYAMRRKADTHFGKICQFFDTTKRCCTIYHARPTICREYPGGGCGYYGFLMAERNSQEDPTHVASTWNA